VQPADIQFEGTDRFRVISRLGAGGMGVVYKAFDQEQGALVALKTLLRVDAAELVRFKNEFRALADLRHPNWVRFGELFETEGRWFFSMELVEGTDFLSYVRGRKVAAAGDDTAMASVVSVDEPTLPVARAEVAPRAPAAAEGFDERRLRAALADLARALSALHEAGKVHRDVKPSNLMVTPAGRVVLLDFGLVTDARARRRGGELLAGTLAYMAPEQAFPEPVGPEADWYAVGVMIYETLTGDVPHTGSPSEILTGKQRDAPRPPSASCASAPADLDALCVELLRLDPAARPGGPEILRRLHAEEAPLSSASRGRAPCFVGRVAEQGALRDAAGVTREDRGVALFVHGESGVGKSALIRRFTDGLLAEDPETVVLSGRCYERESVPYKAVDGIIDELSDHLVTLPEAELAAILPPQRGLIGQVFPVMRRIEAVAQAPRPEPGALDPQLLRTRLFLAVRDLFARLAERHPVVLVIDDLQWADADSLALLAGMMRPPGAPRLLLLTASRTALGTEARAAEARGEAMAIRSVEENAALFSGDVRRLHLEPLPPDDARALVSALLRDAGAGAAEVNAAAVAEEAGGHPLFIDELMRHKLTLGDRAGPLKLPEALRARIERLEPGVQQLLDLVTVAGAPLRQETAAAAARIDFSELSRRVGVLRAASLVRTGGVRRTDVVEPYHDRVREAVQLGLSAEAVQAAHQRLAVALEASTEADPQALAEHWRGAGDRDRAAGYALRAADEAAGALAFDRAAQLYRLALDLKPPAGAEAARLRTLLGDALANAGRGVEAAPVYLEAARSAALGQALTLRRRGAEELLRGGRIDEAFTEFGGVLSAIDMELPETPQRALLSLLYRRARVRLRGLSFHPRDVGEIAPEVLQRIDTCWSVAPVLGMVDIIRGSDFQARCLLMALGAGEPYRVARALAAEAASSATEGGRGSERTAGLLAAAVAAARDLDDPYTLGWIELGKVISSYLEGRWRSCNEACQRAEKAFSRCVGAWWERATVELYAMLSLSWLGELPEQRRRVDRCLRQGKERGDLSAVVNACTGFNVIPWLGRDDPAGARREIDEAMGRWSRRGFLLAHYWEFLARTQIALYEGDGAAAQALVAERWPALSRSLILRVQLLSIESLSLRGRASLATASRTDPGTRLRARLVESAERDARAIEAERMAYATPLGWLLRAGAHALRREDAETVRLCADAARAFEAADMGLFAAVARLRRGETLGGSEGRRVAGEARAWMCDQGVSAPARMAAMLAPGFEG
jgi:tetratricopeptide (TPR) repeat protein